MSDAPDYATTLFNHRRSALIYLLPNGKAENGKYYHGTITVDLERWTFVDVFTGDRGDLVKLWQHVRGPRAKNLAADINHFLLNRQSPVNMERFCFDPETMNDVGSVHGDSIEIFSGIKLYAGTTTLLAGYNGSGKSTLSTQIAHMLANHGLKSFILSPEMPPAVTGRIMQRQATNVGVPTDQEWRRAAQHCRSNFLISTLEDRITPTTAISQFNQAYTAGCRFMVLDSLTCVRAGHELYQQANFADDLRNWSRSHPDTYLLVLAHMRKPAGYVSTMVSRYDIRGAGEISDLAGHIWLLQRKNPFSDREKMQYGDFDAKLIVDKNRATGNLTCKMLHFSNHQKLFHATRQPPRYIDYMQDTANVERIY